MIKYLEVGIGAVLMASFWYGFILFFSLIGG